MTSYSRKHLVLTPDCGRTIDRRRTVIPEWPKSLERRGHVAADRSYSREVLLVDDDAVFVETLSRFLKDANFSVIAEFTLSGALKYLTTHTPDALITDLQLCDGDGWALAVYARTHQPSLPVVAVTGWSSLAETDEDNLRTRVFLKPFDPDTLLNYLESVL